MTRCIIASKNLNFLHYYYLFIFFFSISEHGSADETERFISLSASPVKLDPGLDSIDRGAHLMMVEKRAEAEPPIDK